MPTMLSPATDQLLSQFMVRFFFVFGIIGFAVGVGLVLDHVRMHRMFGIVNHWVSMRRSTKWLAIPRDTSAAVARNRHLIGGIFILVATYSTLALMTQVDVARIATMLRIDAPRSLVVLIIASARWCLVAGGGVAIAVGILLIFFPGALNAIESRANRWYSFRQHAPNVDVMHMDFDRWAERHPRFTGWILAGGALVVTVAFGTQLFAHG